MKLTIFANRMSLDVETGTWKNDPNNKHFKTTYTIRWIDVGLKLRRARLAGFANGILTTHPHSLAGRKNAWLVRLNP